MRVFMSALALVLTASMAQAAETPGPATSAGPGRVICKNATTCELGIGSPAKLKYRIDVTALPAEDKDRLTRQCGPEGEKPCIATFDGTEMGDPVKIEAAKIKWYN